jgi:hypothetical protein
MIVYVGRSRLFKAKQADIGSIKIETKGNQTGTQEKNYHQGLKIGF